MKKRFIVVLLCLALAVPLFGQVNTSMLKTIDGDTGTVATHLYLTTGNFGAAIGHMSVAVRIDSITGYVSDVEDVAYVDSCNLTFRTGTISGNQTAWKRTLTLLADDSLHIGNWTYSMSIEAYMTDIVGDANWEETGYGAGNIYDFQFWRNDTEDADTSSTGNRPKHTINFLISGSN